MTRHREAGPDPDQRAAFVAGAVSALLESTDDLPAGELTRVVDLAGRQLGAESARLLVADYALVSLLELGEDGPTGHRQTIDGTLAGRAFTRCEVVVSPEEPPTIWVPLTEGSERIGVLELSYDHPVEALDPALDPIIRVLVLLVISLRRYTDVMLRSRRSEPLSLAAEMQWDLLPPLTCSTRRASVTGILEPAYSIGGDSFDYAVNPNGIDFAIIDACGHGMSAVLMSVMAINCLRNARREGVGLEAAYLDTGQVLEEQFGECKFVTAQLGSLAIDTGELVWLNAGHPLPLLVRDGTFVGELPCRPSLPLGLGGAAVEIARTKLQPGDRVLFFTDGVTETRSPEGEQFGVDRLADYLVRATLDRVFPAETVRRLSASIMEHNGAGLSDDATLLLLEYHGSDPDQP